MGKEAPRNIILIGFSFTGKTTIGQEVARRLGWTFVDSDDEIVAVAGKSIPQIFAQDGEPKFRELERQVLERLCAKSQLVISTGGGAIVDPRNRELLADGGVVVCLEAKPQTIYQRLLDAQKASAVVRPLLAGDDPLKRIESLKLFRQPFYAMADWTVHTDALSISKVCDEVIRGWRLVSRGWNQERRRDYLFPPPPAAVQEKGAPYCGADAPAFTVTTATESYPFFVGGGLLDELGNRMRQAGLGNAAYIISDEEVFPRYGARAGQALKKVGFEVHSFAVPPGEGTKTVDTAVKLYDWLVSNRAERGSAVVALGGGMVGDLAGFVAATFLRGLPLVQVPTTLVAMGDSSIGGKVAVNHPSGKNLIGAFYQPRLVVTDVTTLATLPRRELISGWAEVIKHALILDPALLEFLEANRQKLLKLETVAITEAVKRSAFLKAGVIGQDEKEQGRRMILNYGHTVAHGLETATDYSRFLHGEAVAIGMMAAAMLSQRLGLLSAEVVERQGNLLQGFGLPTSCTGVDKTQILQAMELDKKVKGKAVRWVLLDGVGKPVVRTDVPFKDIIEVLEQLVS